MGAGSPHRELSPNHSPTMRHYNRYGFILIEEYENRHVCLYQTCILENSMIENLVSNFSHVTRTCILAILLLIFNVLILK